MALDAYEQKLLEGWEEVHKKGQLTLWIMLALKDSPKHMQQIKDFVTGVTKGNVSADDQSMYRALRRYYDSELVDFKTEPGNSGPDRKIYSLTKLGTKVLKAFLERNVAVFYRDDVVKLVK